MFNMSMCGRMLCSRITGVCGGIPLAAVLMLVSVSCHADGYPAKASKKLGTGCINAATCWVELPLRVYGKFGESRNAFVGACLAPTLGVLEGNTLAAGRLAAGLADVSTFPVPWPMADFEPIMEPVWRREASVRGLSDTPQDAP